jgi:hypothetical protein
MSDPIPDDASAKIAAIRREAEERDAARRAETIGVPYVDIRKTPVSVAALQLIPQADSERLGLAAIELRDHHVSLAAEHPTDPDVQAYVAGLVARNYEANSTSTRPSPPRTSRAR